MSIDSLKVTAGQLISTFVAKYNLLIDKIIYNVEVDSVSNKLMLYSNEKTYAIDLPSNEENGTPENTDYSSNNFIKDGDDYNKVISQLDAILGNLAPATASSLSNTTLQVTGTFFQAKLPAGLDPSWYGTRSPGTTINTYSINNTINFTTPATTFHVGSVNVPVGKISYELNNSQLVSLPISIADTSATATNSIGTAVLHVSSTSYNNIWQRATASSNFVQTKDGYAKHVFKYLDTNNLVNGESNPVEVWYDSVNAPLSFSSATQTTVTAQLKYLSGVAYYTTGTVLSINYIALNVFKNGYHPTTVSQINSPYFSTLTVNPTTIPTSGSNFTVTQQVSLTTTNLSSNQNFGNAVVSIYKPTGATVSSTIVFDKRICTYSTASTLANEYFFDEDKRVLTDTTTSFTSASVLANGYAQVVNGALVFGSNDYPGKTDIQEYQRFFTKASASNGSLTLAGINYTTISPYGTGDLNILLKLEGSNLYFDLGIPNGSGGNGLTRASAKGCRRDDSSVGSLVSFSFGLASTADSGNNNQYRLLAVFRDTSNSKSISINSIITT